MNLWEKIIDENQILKMDRDILEKGKQFVYETQKQLIEVISEYDETSTHYANLTFSLGNEAYNIAEKIVDNVGNLLEANFDNMEITEQTIKNYFPNPGDHIYVFRPPNGTQEVQAINDVLQVSYTHHGIYIGSGEVIHYLAESVKLDSVENFCAGYKIRLRTGSPARYSQAQIVERAYSRIGEDRYNVLLNNCEHFCRWCRCGED